MASKGTQKAAMLLASLDAATAAELLKGLPSEDIQEIGAELAQLDSSGRRNNKEEAAVALEFHNSIVKGNTPGLNIKSFLGEMLVSTLGKDKAHKVQTYIAKATEKTDPFAEIRLAETDELILALEGTHPQTMAVVLSELPPKKCQDIMAFLKDDIRTTVVCKMTTLDLIRNEVKHRIAAMVLERLRAFKGEKLPPDREQTLRKLAIVLGGLHRDLRDKMIEEIGQHDEQSAKKVRELMVTWEDIPAIVDRSLQEALRSVDLAKLALALYGAEDNVAEKIEANISDRATETLQEEMSLMQDPLEPEILDARDEIIQPLREANEQGTLRMIGR